jgi:hypothetical protein
MPPFSAIAVSKASGFAFSNCAAKARTMGKSEPVNAEMPMAMKPMSSHHFRFFFSISRLVSSSTRSSLVSRAFLVASYSSAEMTFLEKTRDMYRGNKAAGAK